MSERERERASESEIKRSSNRERKSVSMRARTSKRERERESLCVRDSSAFSNGTRETGYERGKCVMDRALLPSYESTYYECNSAFVIKDFSPYAFVLTCFCSDWGGGWFRETCFGRAGEQERERGREKENERESKRLSENA